MSTTTLPQTRELTLTRLFDAPRALVFKCWTDPVHMQLWWGPKQFTNPVCQMDVRVGGNLRIVMRAPDNTDYPMTGTFEEITPPERLVINSVARDAQDTPLLTNRITVTFEDLGGKTKLTVHSSAVGLVPISGQMLAGMEPGWNQSLEKLTALVSRLQGTASHPQDSAGAQDISASDREITLTRIFNAPRELIFKAWTDTDSIANWWGPRGFKTTTLEHDLRPGGVWRSTMHGPDGTDYPNLRVYRQIDPPNRLVYHHGSDPDRPIATGEPIHFEVTITFEDLHTTPPQTKLTMHSLFPTPASRKFVVENFGAIEGGKQTLARLAEYLSTL